MDETKEMKHGKLCRLFESLHCWWAGKVGKVWQAYFLYSNTALRVQSSSTESSTPLQAIPAPKKQGLSTRGIEIVVDHSLLRALRCPVIR